MRFVSSKRYSEKKSTSRALRRSLHEIAGAIEDRAQLSTWETGLDLELRVRSLGCRRP